MSDATILFLIGAATAFATGLGAVPVIILGERAGAHTAALTGFAAGLMTFASVRGLLIPALQDGNAVVVVGGLALGVGFLLGTRVVLRRRDARAAGDAALGAAGRRSALVVLVLFVHSLPEGLAIGTAYASTRAGLPLFVILAIGLQNIPEGTAAALPLRAAGASGRRQFWGAVLTSAPQPFGAVAAFLLVDRVTGILPASFAFAAGAMLALVVVDMVPAAFQRGGRRSAGAGAALGAATMLALSAALGV